MRVPDPSLAPNRAEGRRAIKALGGPALLSLIPWAAFIIAVAIADAVLDESASVGSLLAVSPFYLGFVALPCFLPIAATRWLPLRIALVVAMTGVAATVGVQMVSSDSSTAGLIVLWIPFVAIPLAFILWVGESVVAKWRTATALDHQGVTAVAVGATDRLTALGIDVAIVGAVLAVPLTALTKSGPDLADYAAGAIAVLVGTLYLGGLAALRGGTFGHALMRITVVDAQDQSRLGFIRALVRGLIIVLELLATVTIVFAIPAIMELASVADRGSSITDRVLKTAVIRKR